MKRFALPVFLLCSLCCFSQQTFHDFSGETILGDPLNFSTFYGKKVMVVNTATYCSYTYQYEELESLYAQYRDSNFMIVGFPCNDFAFQEPHDDSTINAFCIDEYGIQFQMMSKVSVIASDTADVYKWLQQAARNGVANAPVSWNFNKFLIDEAGHWVAHFPQQTSPFDTAIINWLKSPSVIQDTTATGIQDGLEIKMVVTEVNTGTLQISLSNVSNQKTTVSLYSTSGQLISTLHDGMLSNNESITTDVSALSKGIYFLQVKNEAGSKTFRVALTN